MRDPGNIELVLKTELELDIGPAFEAITSELGVQYSLGYYPKSNSGASHERAIKVRVRYPNLVVRARDSYSTAPVIARQNGGN